MYYVCVYLDKLNICIYVQCKGPSGPSHKNNNIHISYNKRIFLSEMFGAWKTKHIPFKPRW